MFGTCYLFLFYPITLYGIKIIFFLLVYIHVLFDRNVSFRNHVPFLIRGFLPPQIGQTSLATHHFAERPRANQLSHLSIILNWWARCQKNNFMWPKCYSFWRLRLTLRLFSSLLLSKQQQKKNPDLSDSTGDCRRGEVQQSIQVYWVIEHKNNAVQFIQLVQQFIHNFIFNLQILLIWGLKGLLFIIFL